MSVFALISMYNRYSVLQLSTNMFPSQVGHKPVRNLLTIVSSKDLAARIANTSLVIKKLVDTCGNIVKYMYMLQFVRYACMHMYTKIMDSEYLIISL